MIKNYFKIAFRNLWKNKVFSALNTLGLSIAMAIALIIFLYIANELSTNNFQEKMDRTYLISTADYYTTPPLLLKSIGDNIPDIESKLRLFNSNLVADVNNNPVKLNTCFGDSSFFNFFSFKLLQGDRSNVLKEKGQIVLTESLALKIFGSTDVVGKTLDLSRTNSTENHTYKIMGIMENIPDNSSIRFDAVTNFFSLENLFGENFEDDFSEWSYISLILLNKNTDLARFKENLDKKLVEMFLKNDEETTPDDFKDGSISELIPLSSLYFDRPEIHVFRQGDKNYIYIYLSIALFILLIAAVNYINLSTAISFERNKETGVRMVFGAQKKQLILKFLLESVIITFISFVFASMFAELALPEINSRIPDGLNLGLFKNPPILIFFISGSIIFGFINGLFPAIYLSRVDAAKILKGEMTKGRLAEKLRSGLIIFQFLIAAVLISFTLTVFLQLSFLKNMELGFKKENVVKIPLSLNIQDKKKVLKAEVLGLPFVEQASIVRGVPGDISMSWGRSFKDDDIYFKAMLVDEDLIGLLQLGLVKGRNFSNADQKGAYIINEALAKKLETENPIGENISNVPIVGVVKDFNFKSAKFRVRPLALYYGDGFFDYRNYLLVKLMPHTPTGKLNEIKTIWESFSPEFPFEYSFLDQSLEKLYSDEKKFGDLFTLFSILALFIVCIGLFGLSAYVVKQRTREIGIRKVFGALGNNILALLSKKFLVLVILANVISVPIAWYVMDIWLTNFANRIDIPWFAFAISFILSILISVLTVGWLSIKAARMGPVEAIKYE